MKRKIPAWVLAAVAAVLVVSNLFTLVQLGNLESRLNAVNAYIWQAEERLNDRISSIHQEVDERMKKETGLLALWDLPQGGQVDEDALTIPVTLSFTPKTLTDATQAALSYQGQEIPCTREGNQFTVSLPITLWEDLTPDQGSIVFTEGETTQISPFPDDWWFTPRLQVLLSFQGGGRSGGWGYSDGAVNIKMEYDTFADIPKSRTLSNPRCKILVDGKLWKEIPLDGAAETTSTSEESSQQRFTFSINETIPMDPEIDLTICFAVDDDLGLEYRFVLQDLFLDEEGDPQERHSSWTQIYRAEDGTLLWEE